MRSHEDQSGMSKASWIHGIPTKLSASDLNTPSCTRIPGFATCSATASPLRPNWRTSSLQVFLEKHRRHASKLTHCRYQMWSLWLQNYLPSTVEVLWNIYETDSNIDYKGHMLQIALPILCCMIFQSQRCLQLHALSILLCTHFHNVSLILPYNMKGAQA